MISCIVLRDGGLMSPMVQMPIAPTHKARVSRTLASRAASQEPGVPSLVPMSLLKIARFDELLPEKVDCSLRSNQTRVCSTKRTSLAIGLRSTAVRMWLPRKLYRSGHDETVQRVNPHGCGDAGPEILTCMGPVDPRLMRQTEAPVPRNCGFNHTRCPEQWNCRQ